AVIIHPSTGLPMVKPECVVLPEDLPACSDNTTTGQKRYIADIDNDGNPVCRDFYIDCSLGGTQPGWFLQGFDWTGPNPGPVCVKGGNIVNTVIDCPQQDVPWVEDHYVCIANTGGVVLDGT